MAPAQHPVTETSLLAFTARFVGLASDRFSNTHPLDALELSMCDFMALVGALEDRCGVVLADGDLARCETLGDLVSRLQTLSAPSIPTLHGRADEPADAGRHRHGQQTPERDARRRAPRRRSAGLGAGEAQERQAS